MQTVYDWVTVAIFAGLAVLYLQRSMAPPEVQDRIVSYLPPAVGCAVANYVGNQGQPLLASGLTFAILVYIYFVLKPFSRKI
jgi:hypothetical protein